jgi:Fe-S cluster biosynthesis and repair protein YggX
MDVAAPAATILQLLMRDTPDERSSYAMAARTVKCVKLNRELPGLDPDTPEGQRALKMALIIGGPELRQRVEQSVSARAWEMWTQHMLMVVNEYQLDPASAEANKVLKPHMKAFFFGEGKQVPGYRPPET